VILLLYATLISLLYNLVPYSRAKDFIVCILFTRYITKLLDPQSSVRKPLFCSLVTISKSRVLRVYPPFIHSLLPKNLAARRIDELRIIELSRGIFIYSLVIAVWS